MSFKCLQIYVKYNIDDDTKNKAGEIIRYLLDGNIIPVLHAQIIEEYIDVLSRPK